MTARAHDAGAADGHPPEDARRVLGLVADPDLPARFAHGLGDALPDLLREAVGDRGAWTVQLVDEPFEEMYPDYDLMVGKAREHVQHTAWDLALCITDEPMRDEPGVVVATVDAGSRVAVVSLPALGGVFLRRRLRAVAVPVIASLVSRSDGAPAGTAGTELRRRLHARGTRVLGPAPGSTDLQVVHAGRLRTARLLGGMVRANRPWRLLLGLSAALAGALAGIAFGVLYSSVWMLATALSPLRLAGLTMAAVVATTVWLVFGHDLWERQPRSGGDHGRGEVRLRNASTLLTVAAGAVAFVLAMFVIAVVGVALVIPPDYLAATLGHPVGLTDYLTIAMMATVLGTLVGAVGSGLENDTSVQEATYSYRERERRHRAER